MNYDLLTRSLLLSRLNQREIQQLLEMGEVRQFASGTVVFEDGAEGITFYLLLIGEVTVKQQEHFITTLQPGDFFGEMSLFNNNIRTGEIKAISDVEVLEIQVSDFVTSVLNQEAVATRLMEALGALMMKRLQKQDADLLKMVNTQPGEHQSWLASFAPLKKKLLADWALKYHAIGRPGKLAITATKPTGTAQDLSVAYSPGVAEPCLAIAADPNAAYDYTSKGQLVGVITNGTAVLGLGNIGPLASKPVMEGKAILFKKFADIDAFDLEVDEPDTERFIDLVCALEPTFGGINLEDIKAPECFYIEESCKRRMKIPVFHDDQHGTAIISGAGLINAISLIDKRIEDLKVVFSGSGAAGFSCARFFITLGVRRENVIMTDSKGVYHIGRTDKPYLSEIAADTDKRTLGEALVDADVFVGASVAGLLKPEMLSTMARDPIVFAMANPNPEIDYNLAVQTRRDVIMGTGRSDYPNQINNVIAFPFIFRGALDVRATEISDAMKMAAARAIATLARAPITGEAGFDGKGIAFGRTYLIPKPFDRRLLPTVATSVAASAMETGVARHHLDLDAYRDHLQSINH